MIISLIHTLLQRHWRLSITFSETESNLIVTMAAKKAGKKPAKKAGAKKAAKKPAKKKAAKKSTKKKATKKK